MALSNDSIGFTVEPADSGRVGESLDLTVRHTMSKAAWPPAALAMSAGAVWNNMIIGYRNLNYSLLEPCTGGK